ncbi:MAG: hypothetical protein GY798_14880 [Hyphomicrobiales bacterium]|nr:hypothetical protein [Hyphomicrobiales bacterium]
MTPDYRDQLRKLIDSADPITEDEIRTVGDQLAAEAFEVMSIDDQPVGHGWRRRGAVAVVSAVLVAAVVAVVVWVDPGGDEVITEQPPVTEPDQFTSTPTLIPAVSEDPVVSCAPMYDLWFAHSLLSSPAGAENGSDPAAEALRDHIAVQVWVEEGGVAPRGEPMAEKEWRRMSESDSEVVFVSGEMPTLSFLTVTRNSDGWVVEGEIGENCDGLWVRPDGLSPALWHLAHQPDLDASELTLQVSAIPTPCSSDALTADELVGPDVIETTDTVTIRVATHRPLEYTGNPDPSCLVGSDSGEPLEVTVELTAPLGDRQILNASYLDPRPLPSDLFADDPEDYQAPLDPTEIEVPGGTATVEIWVESNDENECDYLDLRTCTIAMQQAALTVTANGQTASGRTNEHGRALVTVPEGPFEITAEADDLWCPTMRLDTETLSPAFSDERPVPSNETIKCTRLDLPHATVTGTTANIDPLPDSLMFRADSGVPRWIRVPVNPDGTYQAVLEPGTWYVGLGDAEYSGTTACMWGNSPLTIETEGPITFDPTCA